MRKGKNVALLIIALLALIFASRNLSERLELWSVALALLSLITLVVLLLRPLFARRGAKRAGLPSRYERVKDPWRALDKGEDPTAEAND